MTMIILYSALTASFNRYMVECEYRCMWCVGLVHQVLIDTWWNVNLKHSTDFILASEVLIDTWWNVNLY